MKGVPSIITLKSKPEKDVMNFFDKKGAGAEAQEESFSARQQKKLFEFEGKYENEPKTKYSDDNLNRAIEFRQNKQKHTDFFFKLQELNERIEVFNRVFGSKTPKFIHKESIYKVIHLQIKLYQQQKQKQKQKKEKDRERDRDQSDHIDSQRRSLAPTKNLFSPMGRKQSDSRRKTVMKPVKTFGLEGAQMRNRKNSERSFINKRGSQEQIKEVDEEQGSNAAKSRRVSQDKVDISQNKRKSSLSQKERVNNGKNEELNEIKNGSEQVPVIMQKQDRKSQQIAQQNMKSIDKAQEQDKKNKEAKTQRLQAIERRMPHVSVSQTSSPSNFNRLLNHDKSMNTKDGTGFRSQTKGTTQAIGRNKIVALPGENQNDSSQNVEQKNLAKSNTMTDFKHYEIKIKPKQTDKSILIKSVYEHNLYKEIQGQTSPNKKKRNIVVKANHQLDVSMKKQGQKSVSPRATNGGDSTKEVVTEKTDNQKKLPVSKPQGLLQNSQSTPLLLNNSVHEQKIKQIYSVYNSLMQGLPKNSKQKNKKFLKKKHEETKQNKGMNKSIEEEKVNTSITQKNESNTTLENHQNSEDIQNGNTQLSPQKEHQTQVESNLKEDENETHLDA